MDEMFSAELAPIVVGRRVTTSYITLAPVVWLIYDWMLTLGDEVELIWSTEWSLAGKPMYIFVRYGGMLLQILDLVQMMGVWSRKFCLIYLWIIPIGTVLSIYAMDLLLAYRTLCLYRMNRTLLWINGIAYVVCITASVIAFFISVSHYRTFATPSFSQGCFAIIPSYDFTVLLPGFIYELWLFGLVVTKIVTHIRRFGSNHRQGVFWILVKDSTIWFFVVAGAIICCALGLSVAPRGLETLALPVLRTSVIICGCRMVLQLRKRYLVHKDEGETQRNTTTGFNPNRTIGGGPRRTQDFEDERTRKAIQFAQKIGLPPVTKHELGSWDEDNSTLEEGRVNRHVSSHRSGGRPPSNQNGMKPGHGVEYPEDELDFGSIPAASSLPNPDDYFEMVRVRVDVESHIAMGEASVIGTLTPTDRRRQMASSGIGIPGVRSVRDIEVDSTGYTSSASSLRKG